MGEGGCRIKAVRESTNVRIGNAKEPVQKTFRHLSITGSWVDIWNALCQIIKTIHDDERVGACAEDIDVTMQLKISQSVAGAVIGKAGSNLKSWREKWSACTFSVDDCTDEKGVRWLKLVAKPTLLCEVMVTIADFLETAIKENVNGSLPVRDLSRKQEHQNRGGNNNRGNDDRDSFNKGDGFNRDRKPGSYQNDMTRGSYQNDRPRNADPGFNPQDGGQRGGFDNKRRRDGFDDRDQKRRRDQPPPIITPNGVQIPPMTCESKMVVDEFVVGKIIGSGGSVIKNLRQATGCEIKTDGKGGRTDGKREITVFGPVASVALALGMINTQAMAG